MKKIQKLKQFLSNSTDEFDKQDLQSLNTTFENKAHFSFLQLFPGIKRKTKDRKTTTISGSEVENQITIYKPTGNFLKEIQYIKEELKVDVFIVLLTRNEMNNFGVRPEFFRKIAFALDLIWIWVPISSSQYDTERPLRQWKPQSVKRAKIAMEELADIIKTSKEEKLTITFVSSPLDEEPFSMIGCFLSSFLFLYNQESILSSIEKFPEEIKKSDLSTLQSSSTSLKDFIQILPCYKQYCKNERRKILKEKLQKSVSIAIGYTFQKVSKTNFFDFKEFDNCVIFAQIFRNKFRIFLFICCI